MSAHPPDGSDQPEAVDQVMLAVLSNPGREARVLSADEERLLDDWLAGRLDSEGTERAAALVKRNSLAAERILERRLIDSAQRSPPVPADLGARILARAVSPRPMGRSWWHNLGRWRWPTVVGALALASLLFAVGGPVVQRAMQGGAPIQLAMATIGDRTALFEPSCLRTRGPTTPVPNV